MALIERLQKTTQATSWPGAIPLTYKYTAGRAGEKFLGALRDNGRFLGAECDACGIVYLPARTFCERCFARLEGSEVEVPNRGAVHTFAVSHQSYDEQPKEPSIVAMICLDGADGAIFHRLGEVELDRVAIGMQVEAVFKPKAERTGSLLDIEYFRPM